MSTAVLPRSGPHPAPPYWTAGGPRPGVRRTVTGPAPGPCLPANWGDTRHRTDAVAPTSVTPFFGRNRDSVLETAPRLTYHAAGRPSRGMGDPVMAKAKAKLSRRQFLTRAGAAAVAAPLFVPAHVLGQPGRPGPNGRIAIGVIGIGIRGKYQIANVPPDGRVVAVCDWYTPRT